MMLLQLDVYWYWWMFACCLFLLEILVPDIFFMSLATSSVIVGVVVLLMPELTFTWQFFMFACLSIIGLFFSRKHLEKIVIDSDEPLLNHRMASFVGRVFTLQESIIDGQGQIRAEGSYWQITGQDCPIGTRVRVIGIDDGLLKVKTIDSEPH